MKLLILTTLLVLLTFCVYYSNCDEESSRALSGRENLMVQHLMNSKTRVVRAASDDNSIVAFIKNLIKTPIMYVLTLLYSTISFIQKQVFNRVGALIGSFSYYALKTLEKIATAVINF